MFFRGMTQGNVDPVLIIHPLLVGPGAPSPPNTKQFITQKIHTKLKMNKKTIKPVPQFQISKGSSSNTKSDPGTTLPPAHMHVALRRRLRLALPLTHRYCGGDGFPGCGAALDVLGDHAAACPRSGLLARRAPLLEQAWVRVAREGLGPEGWVVPQQWLANTSAPGVSAQDRRRRDLVLYGATRLGEALCCDATLVAPLRRRPQPRAAEEDGAAIAVARRRKEARYPELCRPGPQRLVVLACETGGRRGPEACGLVDRLVRFRALRAPPAVRRAAEAGWWWALLSAALQRALAPTLLGGRWLSPARPAKESPTSPMSLVMLARPGPAFCLCAASRHVGARASFAFLGGRFEWGGLRAPWDSLPLDGKKSIGNSITSKGSSSNTKSNANSIPDLERKLQKY